MVIRLQNYLYEREMRKIRQHFKKTIRPCRRIIVSFPDYSERSLLKRTIK